MDPRQARRGAPDQVDRHRGGETKKRRAAPVPRIGLSGDPGPRAVSVALWCDAAQAPRSGES